MKFLSSALALLVAGKVLQVGAFVPTARDRANFRLPNLHDTMDTKESEKLLRQEIAERNSVVEDEAKYAVADGERLDAVIEEEAFDQVATTTKRSKSSIDATLERLVKPRAYPLFLAEKAAELVENTVADFTKSLTPKGEMGPTSTTNGSTKEKVVILGTGWGAASLLKDIDTSLYDVTVISPRNYFLFTPMLAGASVGTVEYRSITQPIREVSKILSNSPESTRSRKRYTFAYK